MTDVTITSTDVDNFSESDPLPEAMTDVTLTTTDLIISQHQTLFQRTSTELLPHPALKK